MSGFRWIATYPKSGSTWLRLALSSLAQGGAPVDLRAPVALAPIDSARARFDALLGVDSADLTGREATDLRPFAHLLDATGEEAPRLRKVHDAWTRTSSGTPLFAPEVTESILYVVRDPRDIAISLAHHKAITVDAAIAFLCDEDATLSPPGRGIGAQLPQLLLSWSGHVESWLDAPIARPRLVLRYEDMLADPQAALRSAARHLGWADDPEGVHRAVEETRFDRLRAQEQARGFRDKPRGAASFFRSGVAGAWRDFLAADQARRIEAAHGRVMERLGYPV